MNLFALLADLSGAAPDIAPKIGVMEVGAILAAMAVVCLPVWLLVVRSLQAGRSPWPYEGRRQVPWHGVDVLVVLVLGMMGRLLLAHMFWCASGAPLPAGEDIPPESIIPAIVADSLAGACSLALIVLYLVLRAHANVDSLGLGLRHWRRDLTLGVAAFAFIVPPILALNAVLNLVWAPHHPVIEMITKDPRALGAAAILVVLVAPLMEELIFRVVLQGWLESVDRKSPLAARWFGRLPAGTAPVVLSSALFAVLHAGQGPAPVPLFFLALVLGYLYHQTHRIWPSLVVHAGLNALTVLLLWFAVSNR